MTDTISVIDPAISEEVRANLKKRLEGGTFGKWTRFTMAALGGIPFIGSLIGACGSFWGEADQSNTNVEPLPGNYTYRLYFVVTGADFASVVLNGRFSSDNIGHIFCASGCTVSPNTGNPNTGTDDMSSAVFTAFSISGLTLGTNAIDFIVNNAGSTNTATGLRVEISSVPEPATMMMGAIGLLAVGLLRRRRRS